MSFDPLVYQAELARARGDLDLSFANVVFEEAKHPRLRGRFVRVGNTTPDSEHHQRELTPIPSPSLVERALDAGATNDPHRSPWHGDAHWRCVALTGLELARRTPGADPGFIVTFAMLHDTMRENEYDDPEHGARAAGLYRDLSQDPDPDLVYTLVGHNAVPTATNHDNPNVGICWDADRLNLPRVNIKPDDKYLTTDAAKTADMKDLGKTLARRQMRRQTLPSWEDICKRAQELRSTLT